MSLKSDKLAKRIAESQQFVNTRLTQDSIYPTVALELTKIAESLNTKKLVFQIVSHQTSCAQALVNFLRTSTLLTEACLFRTDIPPNQPQEESSKLEATLVNEELGNSVRQQTSYTLSVDEKIMIGRDPSQCKILLSDDRTLVSGRHLKIEPIQDENTPKWLLCDISRHGTYLNGNRLNECQILQHGDRITLGEAKLTRHSAQFTFNYSSQVEPKDKELVSPLIDCDIFCLLLNGEQVLNDDERWLLSAATQAEITQIIIILEIPSADVAVAKKIETLADELETWFKGQYSGISVEILALLLQPFLVNTEVIEIESYFQKSLDKMTKSLETLVKRKPEDLLTQRLTARFQFQLTKIEQLLETKKATFFKEIGSTESDTQELSKDELKERIKKAGSIK